MKLDYVLNDILLEVQMEIAEEFQIEVSVNELNHIVSSQFSAASFAFCKGVEVRLPKLGKFERRHTSLIIKERREQEALRDILSPEEFKKKVDEAKIFVKKRRKERNASMTNITLDEILDAPYSSDFPNIFAKINRGEKIDYKIIADAHS